jgi:type II secretory pathway pseudopilin PulG
MKSGSPRKRNLNRDQGFTYLGLLVVIALTSLGWVGAAKLTASLQLAEQEKDLLFIGSEYRRAIQSYLAVAPNRYPTTLEDLLLDKRTPKAVRHLRKIYPDPITGKKEWGFLRAPEGGIMGVYSLSEKKPIKELDFGLELADMEAAIRLKLSGKQSASIQAMPMAPPTAAMLTSLPTNSPMPEGGGGRVETPHYSYKDWKFVYRPGVVTGPGGGGMSRGGG